MWTGHGRTSGIWVDSHVAARILNPCSRFYKDKNPWAHLGVEWTVENRLGEAGGADNSPYLKLNNVDPRWHAAIGGSEKVLGDQVNEFNDRKG